MKAQARRLPKPGGDQRARQVARELRVLGRSLRDFSHHLDGHGFPGIVGAAAEEVADRADALADLAHGGWRSDDTLVAFGNSLGWLWRELALSAGAVTRCRVSRRLFDSVRGRP